MSKTTKQELSDGFTPLLDWIVEDVGLVGAAVYGVIYRHCLMRHHRCFASKQILAKLVGIAPRTLIRHLNILVEKGYIKDVEYIISLGDDNGE